MATSGDYRNFRIVDGVRVDHLIDPRTGQPADNDVVSATVVHPQAMWADALATAMMVLGVESGMALADRLDVPVYLLQRSRDEGTLRERYNDAMARYIDAADAPGSNRSDDSGG